MNYPRMIIFDYGHTLLYEPGWDSVRGNAELLKYDIHALGDDLQVNFKYNKSSKAFTDVYLTGPATFVFECDIEID